MESKGFQTGTVPVRYHTGTVPVTTIVFYHKCTYGTYNISDVIEQVDIEGISVLISVITR